VTATQQRTVINKILRTNAVCWLWDGCLGYKDQESQV